MPRTAFFYGTLMAPPRRHVEGAHYPVVIPSTQESEVQGTLVEDLTDGNIWRLDIFKSDECERKDIKVRALESKGRAGDAEQRDVQGDEGRASINDVDDAVAALNYPTSGRGVNGDISRQLESGGQTEEKVLGGAV
ncbi:hypothetical protein G6011_00759 [Alternaria panax]|uniref:Gamma-glutamylcyclotransferase AIG2-like domain-containing protein n=1 Tax=Alternaria panax TaxID=48097 RepID=A0AAD4NV93_9PLEO|nr:hypothetical protein G6011_00759 [Alternaria panax]